MVKRGLRTSAVKRVVSLLSFMSITASPLLVTYSQIFSGQCGGPVTLRIVSSTSLSNNKLKEEIMAWDPRDSSRDDVAGDLIGQALGWLAAGLFKQGKKAFTALKSPDTYDPGKDPQAQFAHTHIVAGSGHGKTELLKNYVLHDLDAIYQGKRSVILMDSQGDMIKSLLHLAEFSPSERLLSDRLVLIDPTDLEYPPCLNMFDFGVERANQYTALEREKLINGAIFLYEYLFGAVLGAELTQKQGVLFRYLSLILMDVPGATIYTLVEFMEDIKKTRPYVSKLDSFTQDFFRNQFYSSNFDNTRQQILNRLYGVLSNRTLARMFAHPKNKLNLFEAMNRGSIILINTAKDLLKQEGTEVFGRFLIALIAQATQERAAIHPRHRTPTFV